VKKILNLNFFKIFIIISAFIFIKADVYAVGENQVSVSTSYSDAINSIQNTQNLGQQRIQTTAQTEDKTKTLAHEAVNGTIEKATQDELNNTVNPEANLIKKEIQKQTKPKKSFVNIFFKFILAIVWVCISSIIIFIILLSYKKLILKGKPATPTYESTEQSLDTPKNFKEAIKLFLDKTKWN